MPDDGAVPVSTQSIRKMIEKIEKKTLVLPEFQRDFVWTLDKTLELFDSLVRNIYIGSLICGIPKFEITVRDFDDSPRTKKKGKKTNEERQREAERIHLCSKDDIERINSLSSDKIELVLDGQQRITSIYRALTGIDEVWYVADMDKINEILQLERHEVTQKFNDSSLEDLFDKFSKEETEHALCVKLSDVYKYYAEADDDLRDLIFSKSKFGQNLSEESAGKYFRAYRLILGKINALFEREKLVSYFLLDMGTDKFALFFERSNSRGIQLSFVDILVAKLYHGFKLRNEIDDFNRDHEYDISPDIAVRALSYIVSGGHNIQQEYILKDLSAEHFNTHWDTITTLYSNVFDYLRKNHYISGIKDLPYENMLITLMIFANTFASKSLDEMSAEQKEVLDWWYWSVAFSKHYTGAANESVIFDCRSFESIGNIKPPEVQKISERFFTELRPIISEDDMSDYGSSRNPVYIGVMGLLRKENNGIINWNNAELLGTDDIDSHHIFPKKYLESIGIKNSRLVDSIANRVLISKITNIKIGKKKPSEYLNELLKKNPGLALSLEQCRIPPEILEGKYDTKYEKFLEVRAELLYDLINKNILEKTERVREICMKLS